MLFDCDAMRCPGQSTLDDGGGGGGAFDRFFVMKTFSEDDIHRSVKFSVWSGGEQTNRRLDAVMKDPLSLSSSRQGPKSKEGGGGGG